MSTSEVINFCERTGASEEEAQHYLEAFNGSLEDAVDNYFDNNEGGLSQEPIYEEPQVDVVFPSGQNSSHGLNEHKFTSRSDRKINTIHDLDQEDNGDDKRQSFYVGGAEGGGGGGQQVLGPIKDGSNANVSEFIDNFFERSKKAGAKSYNPQESKNTKSSFVGPGRRLDTSSSTPVNNEDNSVNEVDVHVRCWRNGFTLNDEPLRSYEDDKNILDDIRSSRVPKEVAKFASKGQLINLILQDCKTENWKAPKQKPFSGIGQAVGYVTPKIIGACDKKEEVVPAKPIEVDKSKPVTKVQLRLPDGGRLIISLNYTHTVADLRGEIINLTPSLGSRSFTLMTGYPLRTLTDESETIEAASLLNASINVNFT